MLGKLFVNPISGNTSIFENIVRNIYVLDNLCVFKISYELHLLKKIFISTSCKFEGFYKEHIFKKYFILRQFLIVMLIICWIALIK